MAVVAATVLATPLLLAASPNHGHPSGHDPAKDAAKLSRQLVRASSGKDAYRHLQQFQAIADSGRIPTVGVTQADGERLVADLAKGDEVTVSFEIREFQEPRTTRNVIAETRGGNAARTVMRTPAPRSSSHPPRRRSSAVRRGSRSTPATTPRVTRWPTSTWRSSTPISM